MKIIVDMDNPQYYEIRAIEFIQEAVAQVTGTRGPDSITIDFDRYHKAINRAIGLLALARISRGYTIDKASK